MELKRLVSTDNDGMILEFTDRATVAIPKSTLDSLSTEENVNAALQTAGGEPMPIFVHKNSDGSWAIAFGQEPEFWPEDRGL